ncbi:MAG TPA: M17 family peptidase N-terminal domain-containing protein [archaeon]|nr:M17 family peptidase N-terminal domain-containing protein [archaeon]
MPMKISFPEKAGKFMNVSFIFEGQKSGFEGVPESFTGKKLQCVYLPEKNAFIVGLGKKAELQTDYFRRGAARASKTASASKISGIHFNVKGLSAAEYAALAEGAALANYDFDKYKAAENKSFRLREISFPVEAKNFSKAIGEALIVCENVFIVRDLVSENSDVVTPEFLEKAARKIAQQHKMKFSALQEKQLKKLGFGLLLGVAQASTTSPRVIILEYNGDHSSKEKTMFAGKGVCFDSGGLNLKIEDSMKDMRMDMAGAAAVLGIMKSAAELKLKKNIVGIIGCVENLIGEKAFRPGDVIKSFSGKTVENLNTDAEGRLVLADVLSYGAKTFRPSLIVEYSTLTGAVVRVLGHYCAGIVSTADKKVEAKILEAGLETHELVWLLPLFEEYREEVKGERAVLRSIGKGPNNGTIYGGAFLAEFTENTPFIHIDIAGTGMLEEATDYMPKDGSGFGVRLAIEFLKKL